MDLFRVLPSLVPFILIVFLVRLLLSFLPSFTIDMNTWLGWTNRLAELGPGKFYSDDVWTQYTPGFLYWLWLGGLLDWANEMWVKFPVILADILTGGLIWWVLQKENRKIADTAFFLYTLNPAMIFTGSVWGQVDGLFTLSLFISVFFLVHQKSLFLSGIFWAFAFLVKPQAIAIVPPLMLIAIKTVTLRQMIMGALGAIATTFLGALAFFPDDPLFGLPKLILKMGTYYDYTSLFAFNIWSLVGMWQSDAQLFLGFPYFWWGIVLYVVALLFIFYKALKNWQDKRTSYFVIVLSLFAFFLFPTRVHERYLFPFFAFLMVWAGISKSKKLLVFYIALSLLYLVNLYHPYAYYTTESFLRSQAFLELTGVVVPVVAVGLIASFIAMVWWDRVQKFGITFPSITFLSTGIRRPIHGIQNLIPERHIRPLLLVILSFALFSRLVLLWFPDTFYFDEVYHAFTAREILRGNPQAWEFWSTPPEGFAYEWTHPPLAKLGMVVGMMVLGEDPVGWRLSGALLGVGVVFLVYLLATALFKNKTIGILASSVFALDGLPLVMSRIGMNDTYFLFFALFSIYLFLRSHYFLSSIFLGLAGASKWTVMWVAPIIFIAILLFKIKPRFKIFWFLIIPPLIYLSSYVPFFTSGHTVAQFIELQKQMWWYHTGLEASHAFQSSWWSWPLMLRPVWLFSEAKESLVSNIYAIGNPLVFWIGLMAIVFAFFNGVLKRQRTLLFVVLAWGLLFLPWALSPRVMFLYHYLPALPFLSLALAWFLSKQNKNVIIFFYTLFTISYLLFYPHWTGIFVPEWLDNFYYWLPSWK